MYLYEQISFFEPESDSFEHYASLYLKSRISKGVSKAYIENIEICLNHLKPLFPYPVGEIRATMIQELLNDLCFNNPNALHGKTSKRTLHEVKRVCRAVLQLAINDQVITFNPVLAVELPNGEPKHKRQPLSEEQIQWILSTPGEMQTTLLIALYCGLRRSEILALTTEDIDFERRVIVVNKHAEKDGTVMFKTKTEAGKRDVPVPAFLLSYLKKQTFTKEYIAFDTDVPITASSFNFKMKKYMWQIEEKYGDPASCPKKNIGKNGKVCPPNHVITGVSDPWFNGFTINRFSIHQARHSYCTMCFDAGLPERACVARMGHADSQMIHQVYLHLSKEQDEACRELFDKYCNEHVQPLQS